MYSIIYDLNLKKELLRIPKKTSLKILEGIEALSTNPRPLGCKKLKGFVNTYRIRIGNYRVLYNIFDEKILIIVIKIGNRKDVYE